MAGMRTMNTMTTVIMKMRIATRLMTVTLRIGGKNDVLEAVCTFFASS